MVAYDRPGLTKRDASSSCCAIDKAQNIVAIARTIGSEELTLRRALAVEWCNPWCNPPANDAQMA